MARSIVIYHFHQNISDFGHDFLSYLPYQTMEKQVIHVYTLGEAFGSPVQKKEYRAYHGRPVEVPVILFIQSTFPTKKTKKKVFKDRSINTLCK